MWKRWNSKTIPHNDNLYNAQLAREQLDQSSYSAQGEYFQQTKRIPTTVTLLVCYSYYVCRQ